MTQRTRKTGNNLSDQVEEKVHSPKEKVEEVKVEPNFNQMIDTGSTLLNLAISGGVVHGGGIPGGGLIMEVFGPPGIGKTSLLCEIAGDVQRKGGEKHFEDPEARLSRTFAEIFDLKMGEDEIGYPDTPIDVFKKMHEWQPKNTDVVNGWFIDSTAALASDLEMENKKDEYSRRAKLFSQELRKAARMIKKKNILIALSNQIREKMDAAAFGEKTDTPGGQALKFYSSLRLKASKSNPHKITKEISYKGKKLKKTIGVATNIEVYKSSVWEPHHSAPVYILFDYGIDNIRANLEYVKKFTNATVYYAGSNKLSNSMDEAIAQVEEDELEDELEEQVINIWEEIESKFKKQRKNKKR